MNLQDIKKVAQIIQYEDDIRAARKDFREHGGPKFFDKKGWGYIVDGKKLYKEVN